MGDQTRRVLSVLLAVIFFCCTGLLIRQQIHEHQADKAYQSAALLTAPTEAPSTVVPATTTPPETTAPTAPPEPIWVPEAIEDANTKILQFTNLDAIRKINPDIVAWIQIPGTEVNYPVLQGEDNDFYLDHAWDGTENVYGSIFLEQNNTPDMADFNTILYGHNMRNGSMFAVLHDFDDPGFWEQHPYVYLVTDEGVLRYEIFSSYDASVDSSAYQLSFRQTQTREQFLSDAKESSLIDTGITPAMTDRILTLSTCTGIGYSARRVVHARLRMVQILPE